MHRSSVSVLELARRSGFAVAPDTWHWKSEPEFPRGLPACYAGIKALLDSYDIILALYGRAQPHGTIRLVANRAVILPLPDSQANRVVSLQASVNPMKKVDNREAPVQNLFNR
jgi:hypothetical protein